MDDVVRIEHLVKKYDKFEVLKDIDFKIKKGEIFGLLGPSGSGKTTLVKHIVGIEKATSGEVFVIEHLMPNRSVTQHIGYMGQSDALYEDLTGYENLMFFASLYDLNNKSERIDELFKILDLEDAKRKKVSTYSGGMKKRLSLAIAIMHEPDLLILDEPTVGIDPVLRKGIWEKFYQMQKAGSTIIMTTHVMEEIEKCDRAALIRDGSIVALDTICHLKEKTNSGKIEELFFQSEEKL